MPQAERVILEAEDEVTPVVNKANAGLDSFEKKAESSHGKVIRITDQTRSSVQRLITSLEKQAETYGKSGVDRLIAQRDSLLQRYAKEPQAIDSIIRSYERMIETQKKNDAEVLLEKQSHSIQTFGERVAQSIENPVQGASGAVGSLLTKIGPLGAGLAAGAAVFTGFAVAAFDAAKSLGEYGVQVKDAELRTGLTSKEVGQFGFAARAVGQDVTIFERMMRGLSAAVEDSGKEGEKARTWLTRFGIDIEGVRTGMVPTSQVLLQVSEGLEKLPAGFDRDRVALDLFKRAGIEAIPVMDGLRERVSHAKEMGFGITEADVKKYEELNQKAVEFEMKWESAIRSVKGMLVDLASAFASLIEKMPSHYMGPKSESRSEHRAHVARVQALEGQGIPALQSQLDDLQAQMDEYKPGVMDYAKGFAAQMLGLPYTPSGPEAQRYGQAAVQAGYVKEALDALTSKPQPHPPLAEPPSTTGDNGLSAAMRSARRELAETNSDRLAAITAERQEAINDAMEKFKAKAGPLVELLKQVYDAKWVKEFNTEAERTSKELEEQSRRWDELKLKSAKAIGEAFREDITEGIKKLEEQGKAVAKLAAEWVKLRDAGAAQTIAHEKRMISATEELNRPLAIRTSAQMEEQKRQAALADPLAILAAQQAIDLNQIQQRRQAALSNLSTNPLEAIEQRAVAEKEAANAIGELRYQWEEKLAEFRKKADEEQQQRLDEQMKSLERITGKLLDTLFTKPQNFGKELENTLRGAVMKPITEGFAGMISTAIHPLIYGSEGKGGIAGTLHGLFGSTQSHDPVKIATDLNTAVTAQNSAALEMLTAVVAASMGISAPSISTPAIAGIGGVTLPNITAGTPAGAEGTPGASTPGPLSSGTLATLLRGLPKFAEGGVTSGPTIVGEAGPELVVPLSNLRNIGLPASVQLAGHYGPETDAALEKAATGLMGIALPAGLSALGGPAGISVGNTLMSMLVGGVGAATPPRQDDVMLGMVPFGPPGAQVESAALTAAKAKRIAEMAKEVEFQSGASEFMANEGRYRIPRLRAVSSDWKAGSQVESPTLYVRPGDTQFVTYIDVPPSSQGQGVAQALYVAAMKRGPINWADAGREGLAPEAFAARAALLRKGLAEKAGDQFRLTKRALELLDKTEETTVAVGRKSSRVRAPEPGPGGDRTTLDLGSVKGKLPQYDDGGTVASTGLALVHKGEAVIPQADSLKKAIDANTSALLQSPDMFNRMLGFFSARVPAMRNPYVEFVTSMTTMPKSSTGVSGGGFSSVASTDLAAGGHSSISSGTSAGGFTAAPWYGEGGYSGTTAGGYTMAPWAGMGGSTNARMANLPGQLATMGAKQSTLSSGFSQMGQNLKNSVWSGKEWTSLQNAGYGDIVSGAGAIAKSPAAGAAGMWSAESGLLGSHMGTWEGTAMGAAGGAEIGFQVGGPLGAAIGAIAGFGVGVGEIIAGVKSPERKAHDDIKSIYGVDIPQNSGTIKQVVSIAQSEFGNDIAVAVRSPKVRQLVMLYSEATGQKMPLSASAPYAGSLVESGGNLYQQASFQNNAWHTYQSNLPTLGGITGSPYPTTPGPNTSAGTGATYLSLNINGTPITADFVADQSLAAQNASYGRTQQAANLQVPGLMVGA